MWTWLLLWNPLIVLWCLWVTQSILVAIQSRKFARRVAMPPREWFDDHSPKTAVIMPFKGHDHDLPRNVRAILNQRYDNYRLVFVFESEDDPARRLVEDELDKFDAAPQVDLVVAGIAPPTTGQKVHNQLAALSFLDQQNDDSEVWVFADSDAVPGPGWLQKLVGPHQQEDRVGVTTGYRWLMPELRAQRPRTASMFASVINSAVAMFMGHDKLTQAWGGSMAVRADFAREHNLVDNYFQGSLSDDYQMTRLCRDTGQRVYFVHQSLIASPINLNWGELLEFGRRQYLITRIHDPKLFRKAVGVIALYVAGFFTAWLGLILGLISGFLVAPVLAAMAIVTVASANQLRAMYRRRAIASAFGTDQLRYLRHTIRLDQWGTIAVMVVNLVLLLSATLGNTLTWRNNRYRLDGPQQIEKIT
ncbi:glycosyltransferase [Algisphaera agarilytica]|uniref:Cellulose synthase/poly-beta-1,6-N-acetylglucosamine synthase-like glycosyltransferase n=1 Tax=Algisphaera agarilytica TaxID=1385975 RepID=A0A7X0LJT0_9BACT|nr:glycosyltransferase family 2 protein [Algisphaera agarilytica]MBB6429089.1 cellulose synthase/poly-beta-1,6-N-acetylglucosamine synthase-like glycosyltransferase [Algisphaera agarilytica]